MYLRNVGKGVCVHGRVDVGSSALSLYSAFLLQMDKSMFPRRSAAPVLDTVQEKLLCQVKETLPI